MRTMSGSPCLHYDCPNRNSFGYCRTTVCINEHYQQEQWGSPSTTNKSESVIKKTQTNADRIRAMTDEDLAEYIRAFSPEICPPWKCPGEDYCYKCWLDWLKSPVEVDNG